MKPYKNIFLGFLFLIIALQIEASPNKSYPRSPKEEYIEQVFVVNVIPNKGKLQEYLRYHSKIWPEVEAGFKKAGYKRITLYRFDHLIIMTILVPKNANLGKMGKLAESYSPKCAQWNRIMSTYQTGVAGASAGQTWVKADQFYRFEDQ